MRDLYLHLHVDERCSKLESIHEAIADCHDADIAAAAKHILLTPKRKQVYDRNHRTLSLIGEIKAELAVPVTAQWEQVGCQDFDMEYPGDLADLLAELDEPVPVTPTTKPAPRIRGRASGTPDLGLRKILTFAIWGLLACILLMGIISVSSMLLPKRKMPQNGHVAKQSSFRERSRLDIRNPGPGHVAVDLYSMSNEPMLTVLVHEGMETRVNVPEGKHRLEFSIGNATDWNGRRFRPSKKFRRLRPVEIHFRTDGRSSLTIPQGGNH